jgi:Uma2 family endonuclease
VVVQLIHHRFTRAEYHRMGEAGIIRPDARVELIDGEILEMSPIGRRHNAHVDRLAAHFFAAVDGRAIVRVQGSIVLGDTCEPEPDLALLRPRDDFYADTDATADAILLLVEVADSSEAYDRLTKTPMYARHSIPELWLVDLNRGLVTVSHDPSPAGYQTVRVYRPGETISPQSFPDIVISVDDVLA